MVLIALVFGIALVGLGQDGVRRLDTPGQAHIAMFEIGAAVIGGCVLAIAYAWVEIHENKLEAEKERRRRSL